MCKFVCARHRSVFHKEKALSDAEKKRQWSVSDAEGAHMLTFLHHVVTHNGVKLHVSDRHLVMQLTMHQRPQSSFSMLKDNNL